MRTAITFLLGMLLAGAAIGCRSQPQLSAVKELTEGSYLIRIACLDTNGDGAVDARDADVSSMADLTGDGLADHSDTDILNRVSIRLLQAKPEGCDSSPQPEPDWLVAEPGVPNCDRDLAVLVYGVGGGEVDFTDRENAAGVRWMMNELSQELDGAGVASYAASVAPGIRGADNEHLAAEEWSTAYLSSVLRARPCVHLVLLGHSYGALHVKAVAATLEEAGLGRQIVLTALIDRWASLYGGTTGTFPSQSLMLNFHQSGDGPIDRANVENIDATGFLAPEDGEEGGDHVTVTHSTVDNSPDVLELFIAGVMERLGLAAGAS